MAEAGEEAPEFRGIAQDGSPLVLSELRGRPVVLYFFPKAGSLGCTLETRGFAAIYDDLRANGVEVVGVSVDPVEAEARFATSCHAPFRLVSDPDGAIARGFGILGRLGLAQRTTFFIGADGRIEEVLRTPFPGRHVRRTRLRYLDRPRSMSPPAPGNR